MSDKQGHTNVNNLMWTEINTEGKEHTFISPIIKTQHYLATNLYIIFNIS